MVKGFYSYFFFGYLFTNFILPYYYLNCLEVVDLVSSINMSLFFKALNLKFLQISNHNPYETFDIYLNISNFFSQNFKNCISTDFDLNVIYLLYYISDYLKPEELQEYVPVTNIQISTFELVFITQFSFIKLIFGKVTSLTFWLIPSLLLFIGGIITFLLI